MSNGKNIPKKSSRRESGTDFYQTHPSSPIYLPLGVSSLQDWLTSLRLHRPVSPSVSLALEGGQMINATSGLKRSELSVRFDPQSSSWRTSQESLLPPENGEPQAMGQSWLGNLPKRGMLSDGKLSGLTTLTPPTDAKDGSALESWLTPRANESSEDPQKFNTRNADRGFHNYGSLTSQVEWGPAGKGNWMTPNTFDSLDPKRQEVLDREAYGSRKGRTQPNNLRDQVAVQQGDRNWPTPRVSAANGASQKEIAEGNPKKRLETEAEMRNWPTPTANEDAAGLPTGKMQKMLGNHPKLRDVTGTTQSGLQDQTISKGGSQSSTSDQTSPQPSPRTLSPLFVEWLMGLPVGWTDLKPLAMESYQQWRQRFS